MKPSEMAYSSIFMSQNRKARPNRSTTNGDMTERCLQKNVFAKNIFYWDNASFFTKIFFSSPYVSLFPIIL